MDTLVTDEQEETVSLVEVVAARDGYLTEEELWAFCKECCLTLEYIQESQELCQSLCLSPDTLAFDHTGSVCFLDLDLDPDPVYIPPEYEDSCCSVKSHLFSVGMSMLYAVKYSTETDNPRPMLGNGITDLLSQLTCDEYAKRPDLEQVIQLCDEALEGKSSQDICLKLCSAFTQNTSIQEGSSILELTSGLSAYLQSQSGFVTSPDSDHSVATETRTKNESELHEKSNSNEIQDEETQDQMMEDSQYPYVNVKSFYSLRKNNADDKTEVSHLESSVENMTKSVSKKKEGMTVNDLLDILDRYLEEAELWALCKEGVIALQRKIKHLPAYISPDTVVVREDGTLSFKPIPEDKPLEVIFMAPELQQKGILSEKTCLYGLGKTLRCAAGHKYPTSVSLPVSQKFEHLLVAMLQTVPEQRPTLLETLDVCGELQVSLKANTPTDVCRQIYEAAINELASPADRHDEDESELCQLYEQNKDIQDSHLEFENLRSSSGHTNADSSWDESFSTDIKPEVSCSSNHFQTVTAPTSAFRPLQGSPSTQQVITSGSTALAHSKSNDGKSSVPSAFSSSLTHFKPIVLHEDTTHKTDVHSEKKTEVMKKLKDLKQNLLKHKPVGSTDNKQSEVKVTSKVSGIEEGTLETLLSKLQIDGQISDTKNLASAIAHYLQGCSEPQISKQSAECNESSSVLTSTNTSVVGHQATTFNSNLPVCEGNNQTNFYNSNLIHSQPTHFPGHQTTNMASQIPTSQMIRTSNLLSTNPTHTAQLPVMSSQIRSVSHQQGMPGSKTTGVTDHREAEGYYPQTTSVSGLNMIGDTAAQGYPQTHRAQHHPVISGLNIPLAGPHPMMNQGLGIPVQYGSNILPNYPLQLHQDPVTGLMHLIPVQILPFMGHVPEQYSGTSNQRQSDEDKGASDSDRSNHNKHKGVGSSVSSYSSSETYGYPSTTSVSQMSSVVRNQSQNSNHSHRSQHSSSRHSDGHSIPSGDEVQCSGQFSQDYDQSRKTPAKQNVWNSFPKNQIKNNDHNNFSKQSNNTRYLSPSGSGTIFAKGNGGNNSTSSSPSPSKDSGVSGLNTAQLHELQKTDTSLMDRLLNNESIQQQKTLGRVLQLIREECNLEKYTTEDLAIAEYITSLGDLKWETFTSAVTEKYCDLHWKQDLVERLYCIVNDRRTNKAERYVVKTPTSVCAVGDADRQSDNRTNKTHQRTNSAPGFVADNNFNQNNFSNKSPYSIQQSGEDNHQSLLPSPASEIQSRNKSTDKSFYDSLDRTSYTSPHRHQYETLNRPQSVCYSSLAACTSETSDSTDTERLEKRRRFKKRYELDRAKSSSMHSLTRSQSTCAGVTDIQTDSVVNSEFVDVTQRINEFSSITENSRFISMSDRGLVSQVNSAADDTKQNNNISQNTVGHKCNSDNVVFDLKQTHSVGVVFDNNKTRQCNNSVDCYKQEISFPRYSSTLREPGNEPLLTNPPDAHPVRSQWTSNKPTAQNADYGHDRIYSTPKTSFPRNRPPQHPSREHSMSSSPHRPFQHTSNSSAPTHTANPTLVRYYKKDNVVYHWAMTQLHEIKEVINFLQTIENDEENKERLENRLRQTQQEIDLVQKERRKTQKLYHKMTASGNKTSNKGDQAPVSGQMLKDLSEMSKNLRYLNLCKTHLKMLLCELYGLDECFLYSLATSLPSQPLMLRPYESNPSLQFQFVNKPLIGCELKVLQAGECEGLMAYLYVSSALSDGYVHQFLYCFRYFVTAEQVLDFILDKYTCSLKGSNTDKNLVRIRQRSLDLLAFWLEGFYSIDFQHNAPLTNKLEAFLNNKANFSEESLSHELLSLLELCRTDHNLELCSSDTMDDDEESSSFFLHVAPTKKWDSFRSSKRAKMTPKMMKDISAAETKPMDQFRMAASLMDLTPVALARRTESFVISDYSPASLVEQLTLLEQEMFQQTHPVHYLNSKAHGVGVALSMQGQRTPLLPRKKNDPVDHNLFVSDPPLESAIHSWITYNQDIAHWVAAEIIVCPSPKSQIAVLSKFIQAAQLCADVRNFATCLAILEGLENLIVRQLPVWKNLSSKSVTAMEELATLKMQLKSDPEALMNEKDSYLLPTIPSLLFFLLHVQQLEIGGFRLANGMYKWGKMRSISQMIDMIRLFQENDYLFERDTKLLDLLRCRIQEFQSKDLQAIASNNEFNVQKVGSKGFHGALRKIKDKLQSKGSK